mgnify:CR=1 FL=1
MLRAKIICLSALFVSLPATAHGPAQTETATALAADNSTADRQAILDHGELWTSLYERGAFEEMRPLYEPDAWLMTNGAPAAKGVDAILTYLAKSKAEASNVSFAFEPENITIDGDYSFLTSKYWMTIKASSPEPLEIAGRSFLVFKRGNDGKWRIWRDIDNQAPDVRIADKP